MFLKYFILVINLSIFFTNAAKYSNDTQNFTEFMLIGKPDYEVFGDTADIPSKSRKKLSEDIMKTKNADYDNEEFPVLSSEMMMAARRSGHHHHGHHHKKHVEEARHHHHAYGSGLHSKGCVLKIRKDFGDPSPIYIHDGRLLDINSKSDQIRLKHHENVTLACPGKGRLLVFASNIFKTNEANVHCLYNNKFGLEKYWTGKFKHIECNSNPRITILNTKEKCHVHSHTSHMYRVGYKVGHRLHELYKACFDKELLTTLYVHHRISPKAKHRQLGGRRPYFTREIDVFGTIRVSDAYHIHLQRKMINCILGRDSVAKTINEHNYLARLQLAPRMDFVMRTSQRATYTYVNTAPQWKHIRDNDWARLEEGLRHRAHQLNTSLRVWSGTYGIWSSEGRGGREHQVFLMKSQVDESFKQIMPVPLYIYKLVYSRCAMKATVFVSINMPAKTSEAELRTKVFCKDLCHKNRKFHWLQWKHHRSVSFCCHYKDVHQKLSLPPLEVNDIFH